MIDVKQETDIERPPMALRSGVRTLEVEDSDDESSPSRHVKLLLAAASVVESDPYGLGNPLNGVNSVQGTQIPVGMTAMVDSASEKTAAEALLSLSRSNSAPVIKNEVITKHSLGDNWRRRLQGIKYFRMAPCPRAVVHPNPGYEKINPEIDLSTIRFSEESLKFEAPKPCRQ